MLMEWYRRGAWFIQGWFNYTKHAYERVSKHFNPTDLEVDLKGKVAVVTGANSGLGLVTARELAARGATVWMICRSEERGRLALQELKKLNPQADLHLNIVDVAEPKQVVAWAKAFKPSPDILVNNAGVLLNDRQENSEAIESTFATHLLGPFFLVAILAPRMSPGSRVVTVTSGGMLTEPLFLDFESKGPFDGAAVYSRCKRMQQVLNESYWPRKHPNLRFLLPHPGFADTVGVERSLPGFYKNFKAILRTPEQGADSIVWCACSPAAAQIPNGSFVEDRHVAKAHLIGAGTQPSDELVKQFVDKIEQVAAPYLQ